MVRFSKIRLSLNAAMLVAAFACAQLAPAEDEPATADPYETAVQHFHAERWNDVVVVLREAFQKNPADPRVGPARFYLAEALLHDGRYAEAACEYQIYSRSETDDGRRALADGRRIEALYFADDYRAVITEAERFLEAHSSRVPTSRVRYFHGSAAFAMKDYAAAEASFARYAADFPDDDLAETTALSQAASLFNLGKTASAWTILSSRFDAFDGEAKANFENLAATVLLDLAREAAADGRLDEAEAWCDRLLRQLPRQVTAPEAAYLRAQLAAERGEWTTAAARFVGVLERDDVGDDLRPQARLGQLYSLAQDGDWDGVVRFAESAQTEYPTWPQAYEFDYYRGRALFARAELDDARTALLLVTSAPAAKGTETGLLAHVMIARTYALQRNNEAALSAYETAAAATTSAPRQIECRLQCGKLREALGRYEEAARDYERITREFPDSPQAAEAERRRAACTAQAETIKVLQRK